MKSFFEVHWGSAGLKTVLVFAVAHTKKNNTADLKFGAPNDNFFYKHCFMALNQIFCFYHDSWRQPNIFL